MSSTSASTAQASWQTSAGKRVKILLVDDTPENLISLEAALDMLGQELVCARSGKEALRCLLEDDFAAILLDVKMPDMDGFETAELIRNRPKSRHTPILFLTGYRSEEHLFRGYNLGAVDFLFKPIVPEVLRSKVAVFVELSRNAERLREQAAELAEQAAVLQRTEQHFRALLEAAPDAMVICREDGKIVLVNSRTESLFCYPRQDLLGQDMHLLVPDWNISGLDPVDEPGENGHQVSVVPRELQAIRQDGKIFPVEVSLSPLVVEDGMLITSAIRDISERKRVERQRALAEEKIRVLNATLGELNSELELRVAQRTEQLQRSNEELAQFAYIASHDLREPLRTVSLYTQLLARRYADALQKEGKEYMEQITGNARRMEDLVRDLLEFCRVDGRGEEHFVATRCDIVLDQALANLKLPIEESGAKVIRDPLPIAQGDATQLISVFQNLIANSIKYAKPDERPVVKVSARKRDADWLFVVEDNGIGIDPQYFQRVFGIFKRLHGRDMPGTGMGLAICKKIISRHRGDIWVESTPGVGSAFYFTLPLAKNGQ